MLLHSVTQVGRMRYLSAQPLAWSNQWALGTEAGLWHHPSISAAFSFVLAILQVPIDVVMFFQLPGSKPGKVQEAPCFGHLQGINRTEQRRSSSCSRQKYPLLIPQEQQSIFFLFFFSTNYFPFQHLLFRVLCFHDPIPKVPGLYHQASLC